MFTPDVSEVLDSIRIDAAKAIMHRIEWMHKANALLETSLLDADTKYELSNMMLHEGKAFGFLSCICLLSGINDSTVIYRISERIMETAEDVCPSDLWSPSIDLLTAITVIITGEIEAATKEFVYGG